jgi:hypothetical protein
MSGRRTVEMAGDPVLLKPAHVPHLPDGRFQEVSFLTQHLVVGQALEKVQLDGPSLLEGPHERGGVYGIGVSLVPVRHVIG